MLNTHKTGEFKEPETYTAEHWSQNEEEIYIPKLKFISFPDLGGGMTLHSRYGNSKSVFEIWKKETSSHTNVNNQLTP
jgi:hypothetical protein